MLAEADGAGDGLGAQEGLLFADGAFEQGPGSKGLAQGQGEVRVR